MRVKKYTATTMNNALVQIKEELGPDAVILNSKPIKKGGIFGLFQKKHIEVIAALDENPVIKKREATEALQINRVDRAVVPPIKAQSDQTDILEEIKQLRQLVKGKSFQSHQSFSAPFDTFYSYLLEQEVNETVAENVVMDMEKHVDNDQTCTFTHFREFLQRQLNSVIEAPLSIHQKVVQFVGPTGVGKTTTIAKVAAKLMLEQKRKIAFITTDTYRIAAIEQLKTYAKILDVPLEVVYTRDDYDKALELFQDFDHIFVDTAGRNYREPHYVEELKNMIKITDERESVTFLVLSLTAKSQDNDEIYHIFKRVGINQVIFTKGDETNTYGTIVNISIGDGAKIGYISNGQNVPDDLMKATSSHMTDLIFSRYRYV